MNRLYGLARRVIPGGLVLLCWAWIGILHAQDFRGSVSGRVLDPSGARVPGAKVALTSLDTNVTMRSETNGEGVYAFQFLTPGKYSLAVQIDGYKNAKREGIEVNTQDKIFLDIPLQLGSITEVIEVTDQAPVLETSTASAGTLISEKLIRELPIPEGNPVTLARYSAGVYWTGDPTWNSPFNNAGSAGVSTGGGDRNEFTIDNMPNTTYDGRARVIFVPPQDMVQEFRISTTSYDAEQGHTAGASISLATKSGTNDFHGTAYFQYRNELLAANTFVNNKNGRPRDPVIRRQPGGSLGGPVLIPKLYNGREKTFFFVVYENIRHQTPSVRTSYYTVPTEAMRRGDFSALLQQPLSTTLTADGPLGTKGTVVPVINPADNKQAYQNMIYDPFSARMVASWVDPYSNKAVANKVFRTSFPNNIIPASMINPVGKALMDFYPLPNTAGDANGQNNFFSPTPVLNKFYTVNTRLDHHFNSRNLTSGKVYHNILMQPEEPNWAGTTKGVDPTGTYNYRAAWGASLDHVYTPTSTLVLNLRAGWTQWSRIGIPQSTGQMSAKDLPFSDKYKSQVGTAKFLPGPIEPENASPFYAWGVSDLEQYKISLTPSANWFKGNHRLKFGYDYRIDLDNRLFGGYDQGSFSFSSAYTKGPNQDSAGFPGQGLASMLLGVPTGGSIGFGQGKANRSSFHGWYVQDEWRATSKLTLTLGLRHEFTTPPTERFDRNIMFDPNVRTSPELDAYARDAYAAAVNTAKGALPEWANRFPTDLNLKGASIFNSASNRGFYQTPKTTFLPRLGLAYQLNSKTVFRAGTGFSSQPHDLFDNAGGYTASLYEMTTPLYASVDNGLTIGPSANCAYCGTLSNPFPVMQSKVQGHAYGNLTTQGGAVTGLREDSRFQNWSIGVQRELPGRSRLEVSYVANRSWNRTVWRDINTLPREFLSRNAMRDTDLINKLAMTVANPFRNAPQLPPTYSLATSTTIGVSSLLRPYPIMGAINQPTYGGTSSYNSAQISYEKQFSKGITIAGNYTWAKGIQQMGLLNPSDKELEKSIAAGDRPHLLHLMGLAELPFGRGRAVGGGWNRAVDAVFGGWQLGWTYLAQSGAPIYINNVYVDPTVDLRNVKISYNRESVRRTSADKTVQAQLTAAHQNGQNIFGVPIATLPFYIRDGATCVQSAGACVAGQYDTVKLIQDGRTSLSNNIRTMPSFFPSWRLPNLAQLDMSIMKKIQVGEKKYFEVRAEFVNAPNNPYFQSVDFNPRSLNFGTLGDAQANQARYVSLQAKFIF